MANYERYQTLTSAEQYLYSPSCPVWVNRYQISWDTASSARLLQCRMVNVAEKAITAVYLRVLCRDSQGQDITTLHMVPLTGLFVPPGDIFGDDKVLTLWPNRTAFAEIYAERVCFSDGSAWNETEVSDYIAIPAPTPVQVQDRNFARLSMAAREGGVRNEVYFRPLKSVWICTCGVPNSNQILFCRHCGADRSWLEKNMDADAIEPPPAPALPAPKEEPQPEVSAPLEKFDLATYLADSPATVPVAEEFPYIETYPERQPDEYDDEPEPAAETKPVRNGRKWAIVLAVLLFLGVGAFFAYRQFLGPYASYQQALRAENEGEYEEAIALYEELGDYEDSADRILLCRAQMALDQMRAENYAQAYTMLSELPAEFFDEHPEYRVYAPDCLYSLGVLAFNEGDYNRAWTYVQRLEQEYPSYDSIAQLRECCCYEFGKHAMDAAEQTVDYEEKRSSCAEAKDWFVQAGSYSNSADMVSLCDYYIADSVYQQAEDYGDTDAYLRAADLFEALGGYSDSSQRRLACMYAYCQAVQDLEDETMARLLDELIAADYPGALELQNELTRLEAEVEVIYVDAVSEKELPQELTTGEMTHVRVRYTVDGPGSGSMRILLVYTLPGAQSGRLVINEDDSRSGEFILYDRISEKASESGTAKLQFYDSDSGEELYSVEIDVVAP